MSERMPSEQLKRFRWLHTIMQADVLTVNHRGRAGAPVEALRAARYVLRFTHACLELSRMRWLPGS